MPMEKTFDAKQAEARIYREWEEGGYFRAGANASRDETFTIMLPPPNVTGSLHVGHAFNHTLMDILTRWKRMQGYDTLWQPGLDHAGIATQLMVEKDMAAKGEGKRTDMPREDFLRRVWEWKAQQGGTIEQQARRLGDSMDWERSAFTMSGADSAPDGEKPGNFHDAVIKTFVKMYNDGLIYRGKRLVNWDPHFETAISDLEVENIETDGFMWHFKYPLAGGATYTYVERDADGNTLFEEERDYIAIATTRPETMLGDGAVAVNPKDERYAPIVGQLCEIPVGPKESRRLIPIITDPYPDMDFGSGAVKITGAHDFNDYEVAKRGNIPMYNLMDTKGAMRSDGRPYAEEAATAQTIANGEREFDEAMIAAMNLVPDAYRGLDRFEARAAVVADITAEGLAVMVPHTDPRLGELSPSSPSSSGLTRGPLSTEIPGQAGDDGRVAGDDGQQPPLAPEEGGEMRTDADELVPLVEAKKIMQPFGDRSKVVIEPMLTDQWFVDTAKIVGPALDAVKKGDVKIIPESGEKVYYHWLENIEPWCISRQLWWGHQIPVWFDEDGNQYCAPTEAEAYALAAKRSSPSSSTRGSLSAEIPGQAGDDARKEVGNGGITLTRDPDVLDTWFSSGLWPFGTLGWPEDDPALKYFPGDVLITGQDILFFWVARMMMMSYAVMDDKPFHTVYLHQLLRDAKGEKMSKTRGNVIDPLDMIDQYGADALRMSNAAMAALGGVLKISEERIKGYRNFGTKLWNACRFAEMNGVFSVHDRCTGGAHPVHVQHTVNKWIIGETARVREEVDAALDAYRFNDAANALYAFVWGVVCDWYVEFSKPLLLDGDAAAKEETQRVMAWVLDQCLILLHPFMPFITEELWGTLATRDEMLVHADWPSYQAADLVDENALAEMRWVIQFIEGIRSTRAQMNVPAGAQVPVIQTEADDRAEAALAGNMALIQKLARVDSVTPGNAPKGSALVGTAGATFALPLADLIDVDAEKARLSKNLGKIKKEIGGLRKRLDNPKFTASAKPEVVAETRENLALREEEEAQLRTAIARLEEIG